MMSKLMLALVAPALAVADFPPQCEFLQPLPEHFEICPGDKDALDGLDPLSTWIVYARMNNKKSCTEFCGEKGTQCLGAVDDFRINNPCRYNLEKPVTCNSSNFFDLHCLCEVPPADTTCDFLNPLTGKNEFECVEGEDTEVLKDSGKNCVALARLNKRSTCSKWCESKGARCVDAVDNVGLGSCEGNYDTENDVDCESTGFRDLHCVCTQEEETTTTTTTIGCGELKPFANPGEKICTEGDLVADKEEDGANCVVYAVLQKRSTCDEFCAARNTVCVGAIDNTDIGTSCEFDTDEEVSCSTGGFFDIHCVCRVPEIAGCGTVQLCQQVCNVAYEGDSHQARCLQHCASSADTFLDFVKGWCGEGDFCEAEDDGPSLLQRRGEHDVAQLDSEKSRDNCRTEEEYCDGFCGSLGYLADCKAKCLAVAPAVKAETNAFCTACVEPLADDAN